MPTLLQLLYQREIDTTIQKRVNENIYKAIKEINKKISSKMDGTKFRSNYVVDEDEVKNDIPNNYNEMLSFLGIIANIDIEKFKSFVDEMMAIYNNQEKTDRVDLTNQKTDSDIEKEQIEQNKNINPQLKFKNQKLNDSERYDENKREEYQKQTIRNNFDDNQRKKDMRSEQANREENTDTAQKLDNANNFPDKITKNSCRPCSNCCNCSLSALFNKYLTKEN